MLLTMINETIMLNFIGLNNVYHPVFSLCLVSKEKWISITRVYTNLDLVNITNGDMADSLF